MSDLPEVGLYVSTKDVKGMSIYVEDSYGDNPDEFYLVETIEPDEKGDLSAMGSEMTKQEWESLVNQYGLELRE